MKASAALSHRDVLGEGAKKRRKVKNKKEKVRLVMHEFGRGTLYSGSGHKVKSRKQAIAIGMSEAELSKKKKRGGPKGNPGPNPVTCKWSWFCLRGV